MSKKILLLIAACSMGVFQASSYDVFGAKLVADTKEVLHDVNASPEDVNSILDRFVDYPHLQQLAVYDQLVQLDEDMYHTSSDHEGEDDNEGEDND